MPKQDYNNHKKYYPPHHFILLPLLGIATGIGFYRSYVADTDNTSWLLFGISSLLLLFVSVMMRQHYALGNQNRIVRLEFRLRYFELHGKSSKETERQLSFAQIAALRFAPDEEFQTLLHRAITENLSANDIKKAIQHWEADHMRV